MKKLLTIIGFTFLFLGCVCTYHQIKSAIVANYNYEKYYDNLWSLGIKSSTIEAKANYVDKFYKALKTGQENGKFAEWNAIWLQTPDNNFSTNLTVLSTLSQRLREIRGMNPNTFEYNTAIQQITSQEQNEAGRMLQVFRGCYDLQNYSNVWGWHGGLWLVTIVIIWIVGIFALCFSSEIRNFVGVNYR